MCRLLCQLCRLNYVHHTHMHTCIHHTHTHKHKHTSIHHTHTHTCIHHTHTCAPVYTTHTCIHHTHSCTEIHTHTPTHMYIAAHTHTHAHTHTQSSFLYTRWYCKTFSCKWRSPSCESPPSPSLQPHAHLYTLHTPVYTTHIHAQKYTHTHLHTCT